MPKKLTELAAVIRSKNAGVDVIACDVMFDDAASYERVKRSRVLTRESIASLYGVPLRQIGEVHEFDDGLLIKFGIYRDRPGGSPGESDMYGAQTYVPLLDLIVA